ncbi:MAG: uracil-DNA glycosylase [bacterium]
MSNKIEDIAAEVNKCTKCPLHEGRTNAVPGEGSPKAEILFIGEGPGQKEDELGRPFVGAAGKFLDQLIESIGLKRKDVFIANVVKCRPPGNRDPLPEEAMTCYPYLEAQVKAIKPKLIVTLGRHSMERFLPGFKISQVCGKPKRRNIPGLGTYVFYPVFHPAAALHNGSFREPLIKDFKRIPAVLKKIDELSDKIPQFKEDESAQSSLEV